MSRLSSDAINLEIGQRLAELREHRRLVQTEFAEQLGISPRAYQNYERGEREVPAAVLRALYAAFGADPLWVLTGFDLQRDVSSAQDADILEQVVVAIETKLRRSRKTLSPEKKARLIKLTYLHSLDKAKVDGAHVADMLALTA